jgi:leucyl-tRNA synthetase
MADYPFAEIEQKWQQHWEKSQEFRAQDLSDKPKFYVLIEFPYPSGAGLHVGHPRSYTALDAIARKRRMQGYNVLFPIGFDAFGLPAENHAIATGTHPAITTRDNIANFKRQLKMLGLSFDWSREVNTTDPKYYKWTQWMFLRMFKQGLAYKAEAHINWCSSCRVGLANEEVLGGKCERCGNEDVIRRTQSQWMLRITRYADRLLDELETVDYIEPVVRQQQSWIGKSFGAEISFPIVGTDEKLTVFTTRPDTVFGATYMVLAPEHPLLEQYYERISNLDEIGEYQAQAARKSDMDRTELAKAKTGVAVQGLVALNPATGKEIPIWISDYVLMSYGTGAIMAVPGHDTRDWEFARTFGLPIVEVVGGGDIEKEAFTNIDSGTMVNSGFLDGMPVKEAIESITRWLEENGHGKEAVNFRLRDWVFSRQRYWGEPIPLIECESCGWVPVPETELPLLLPEVKSFLPSDDGSSPLAGLSEWVNTECPSCGRPARRETDTMPQWAGSCWYYLRYLDPDNQDAFARRELLDYWIPVDWYNGGMEHTTLHLLYSRFWHKFLYDEGLVSAPEPYSRRTSHGMILGVDGEKMSKSRGNVVNPDEVVKRYGADTFRVFEMYLGAFDQKAAWSESGVNGASRFLNRIWGQCDKVSAEATMSEDDQRQMHYTVKAVDERMEAMKFNTAVAALMSYNNHLTSLKVVPQPMMKTLCLLLYPFAPHLAEEIWERLGETKTIGRQEWPGFDPELAKPKLVTLAVQISGKLRDTIEVEHGLSKEEVLELALARPKIPCKARKGAHSSAYVTFFATQQAGREASEMG